MNSKQKGAFLPTTQVWDVSQIYETKDLTPGMRELLVRMYQNLNSMAMMINQKDTAIYPREEFVCGQLYYPNVSATSSSEYTSASNRTPKLRQVIRKCIPWVDPATGLFKTLPNASTDTVAHNLTFDANTIPTRIYGTSVSTSIGRYVMLPWVADTGDDIALWLDGTNVNIKTFGSDRRAFTKTNIVIEYLKF